MNNKNYPAFPIVNSDGIPSQLSLSLTLGNVATGLTKREYFAGLAMQGLIVHMIPAGKYDGGEGDDCMRVLAADAVALVDALLTELSLNQE